ncbi:MAG: 50S ribosomal protein L23 [Nanoarchaeota archaeon]|nr:50S ribosomal protein L23 [Nanoarchaeota archaeon]
MPTPAASKNKAGKSAEVFDPYQILQRPLSTEKSLRQMEFENKLSFVIDPRATKPEVKRAVEELFSVKVLGVNVQNAFKGEKRALVKLSAASSASDIGADLGLI